MLTLNYSKNIITLLTLPCLNLCTHMNEPVRHAYNKKYITVIQERKCNSHFFLYCISTFNNVYLREQFLYLIRNRKIEPSGGNKGNSSLLQIKQLARRWTIFCTYYITLGAYNKQV